ncbi:hypothetical protein MTR_4g035700 [Medicago truncatula]|uniref:Uncharacterized protein n=1 Tax=Medicago truncatula TaxID=3880 RepID=A0A072UHY1_MEDTR|nr:hypothetical protein MTR_4g035700 [Medicago truncatula]
MARRNDQAIPNAMTAVAQALNNALQGQQNQQGGADEFCLNRFMRNYLQGFCPYINAAYARVSKCLKFQNGLRPEIKRFIGYQQIHQFSLLATTCRIYEDDNKARTSHYKAVGEKRGRDQSRGKPYNIPAERERQKFQQEDVGGKETRGGDTRAPLRCFNCGIACHRPAECKSAKFKYF